MVVVSFFVLVFELFRFVEADVVVCLIGAVFGRVFGSEESSSDREEYELRLFIELHVGDQAFEVSLEDGLELWLL